MHPASGCLLMCSCVRCGYAAAQKRHVAISHLLLC